MFLNAFKLYQPFIDQKKFEISMQIFSLLSNELSKKLDRIINHKS